MSPFPPRIGPLGAHLGPARAGGQAGQRIAPAIGSAGLVPQSDNDRDISIKSPTDVAPVLVPIRVNHSSDGTAWLAPFATPTLNPTARRHLASSFFDEALLPDGGSLTDIEAVAQHLPSALQTLRAGLRFDAALRSAPLTVERALRLVHGPQDYALCRLPAELQHERMTDLLRKLLGSTPS